jgi:hypothetical protein
VIIHHNLSGGAILILNTEQPVKPGLKQPMVPGLGCGGCEFLPPEAYCPRLLIKGAQSPLAGARGHKEAVACRATAILRTPPLECHNRPAFTARAIHRDQGLLILKERLTVRLQQSLVFPVEGLWPDFVFPQIITQDNSFH